MINITLHLTTNDKAAKTATIEYDMGALTINGKSVDMGKAAYDKAYYGNCGYKLYLHTAGAAYLFTMTDGWAEAYRDNDNMMSPLYIVLGIVELYDVCDTSWMSKEASND